MAFAEIPRGLADLQVSPIIGDTPGTWADVPGARSLTWSIDADSDELEGDNDIIAKVQNPRSLTGSIEVGRINLASQVTMLGGEVETEGETPNAISRQKIAGGVNVSYFRIAGQAPGVDAEGSAYRVTVLRALATSGPSETMEVNSWNTPTIDFEGLSEDGILVVREQYETEVALPPSA